MQIECSSGGSVLHSVWNHTSRQTLFACLGLVQEQQEPGAGAGHVIRSQAVWPVLTGVRRGCNGSFVIQTRAARMRVEVDMGGKDMVGEGGRWDERRKRSMKD